MEIYLEKALGVWKLNGAAKTERMVDDMTWIGAQREVSADSGKASRMNVVQVQHRENLEP